MSINQPQENQQTPRRMTLGEQLEGRTDIQMIRGMVVRIFGMPGEKNSRKSRMNPVMTRKNAPKILNAEPLPPPKEVDDYMDDIA